MIKIHHGENVHVVPCGKCAFCLTNKRSQWMFRIYHEMRKQEVPGYFLTFTYDEKHVKRVDNGRLSLRFYDIQLYIKRLRKAKKYVKYICVGEYGASTQRPHYHMLLWSNATSSLLEQNWKSSKDGSLLGAVHFGSLTMQSAMYTLKYIIQPKQRDIEGVERTRSQFSKGIGLGYLTESVYNYHTMDYDSPVLFSMVDGRKVALPRYYKNKIFTKYQMRKQQSISKWDSVRKRRVHMRALIAQGVVNTKLYIEKLRAEQAQRIISQTKYAQVL